MSSSPTFSPQTDPWQELNGYCAPDVIRAPKTWGDPLSSMLMDSPQNIQAVVGYQGLTPLLVATHVDREAC